MQEPAQELARQHGPGHQWHTQPWFQMLWFAAENQGQQEAGTAPSDVNSIEGIKAGTAKSYQRALEKGTLGDAGHMAWAVVLLRNILAHAEAAGAPLQPSGWQRVQMAIAACPFAHPVVSVVDRFRLILGRTVEIPATAAQQQPAPKKAASKPIQAGSGGAAAGAKGTPGGRGKSGGAKGHVAGVKKLACLIAARPLDHSVQQDCSGEVTAGHPGSGGITLFRVGRTSPPLSRNLPRIIPARGFSRGALSRAPRLLV